MPGHVASTGSAVGGILEGFLSGAQTGINLRRIRTQDKLDAEERQRKEAEDRRTAGRQEVSDEQAAAEAARRAADHELETGLAPGDASPGPVAPRLPDPTPSRDNQFGILPQGLMEDVDSLRRDTGAALLGQAPAGFHRVGPSVDEREAARVRELRANVSQFLLAGPEERERMLQDPAIIGALDELGELGSVFDRRAAAARPPVSSPVQRFEDQSGDMFVLDPRAEPGERVAPLTFEGEQLRGRRPADNFARSNAQAAANAMSRINIQDYFGDAVEFEAALQQVAQRFGFEDVSHVEQVLTEAVGGGEEVVDVEARATELRAQGLTDDEVIERLRAEGLISG